MVMGWDDSGMEVGFMDGPALLFRDNVVVI